MMVMIVFFVGQATDSGHVYDNALFILSIDHPFLGAFQELDSYPHGPVQKTSKSGHVGSKPRCKRGDRG